MNDYERVAAVIRYLDRHHTEQPDLTELAHSARLSPFHFHRLFSSWAGVTPKDFSAGKFPRARHCARTNRTGFTPTLPNESQGLS